MGKSLWVRDAAEFEPEGDHVVCRWQGSEWIMSFAVAQEVATSLERALVEWRTYHAGDVVQLSKH